MKTNHFFKTILMVMALVFCTNARAQVMTVATVQHGDQMRAFYGVDAFIEAMDAAVSGDLVSLSPGNFNPPSDITKSVTIQGAGIYLFDWNPTPTYILGDLTIRLPEEDQSGLIIEGLELGEHDMNVYSLENFSLIKCSMKNLFFNNKVVNVLVDRCDFDGTVYVANADEGLVVRNSWITLIDGGGQQGNRYFHNCLIYQQALSWCHTPGRYENNIIMYAYPGEGDVWLNNVYCEGINGSDPNSYGSNNIQLGEEAINQLCVSGELFGGDPHLTDEAAATYLGTDGTQVGLFGGTSPLTVITSCPQVTSSQVAPQSDANGKLNVKITVEAGSN